MSSRADKAKELFEQGYNCAQATLGAFSDILGFDFETAMKLSSSFGGGMGKLREVCGAVSAMFMIAGVLKGYSSPETGGVKAEHYKLIQDLAEKFREENGSIICRELLNIQEKEKTHVPSERTQEYYRTRPCAMLVYSAAKIIEEELLQEN